MERGEFISKHDLITELLTNKSTFIVNKHIDRFLFTEWGEL
jgi:hypothetical protein